MPVYWSFTDKQGSVIPLNKIDDEIRRDLGLPKDDDAFSTEYTTIVEAGITIFGNGRFNQDMFDEIFMDNLKLKEIAKDYYTGKYKFNCWYSYRDLSDK